MSPSLNTLLFRCLVNINVGRCHHGDDIFISGLKPDYKSHNGSINYKAMFYKKIKRRPSYSSDSLNSLPPLLARLYGSRGVENVEEVDTALTHLLDYRKLSHINEAAEAVVAMIKQQQKVIVVGDFDADGATSTALLMRALPALGLTSLNYIVPNRFEYGYGLSVEIVEEIAKDAPDWIITVDNGICNHDGVARAKELGIQVLITDHHLPAETLPEADIIVNPNLQGDDFASKSLAGVGVAFYLLIAVRASLREQGYFDTHKVAEPNLASWLDIVALGTVADVVPLDANNRRLVAQGLQRIRRGQCCPGILALLETAKRKHERTVATDLGFAVGPRLNAAGRLEDMSVGIECLITDSMDKARQLAFELDGLNQYRREIEVEMVDEAMGDISRELELAENERPFSLCLYNEDWHQGVVGLVASRIKDKLNRPVIVFAKESETRLKGSGRSVSGVHLRDVLANVAAKSPHLLTKFGGHAMAAGLSISIEHLNDFRSAFDAEVKSWLGEKMFDEHIVTDGRLETQELTLDTALLLRQAGPWGQSFPEPLFDGEFSVVHQRIVGQKHLKLVLQTEQKENLDAIYFNPPEHHLAQSFERVELVYKLDVNEYMGNQSVQMIVEQLEEK
ncbi:single-stranded-DNA-specific exonuclease RecJ [Pleionea sp. CnH1-48]|uniref:single-stranded-DNA-specific exonuclease RecJ n=1 Tax=Pleionea sp. CnH1-48 TaxID=2954494 RepID=UPI00209845C9|nr:single-stranded-DNA-specific exonuclease RecJ [Pleionea sp. CnH1-48]MCO7225511.1 single-stranded-DNA-specific exonuclease RecJ [Pleionea sp. CnH1-48]